MGLGCWRVAFLHRLWPGAHRSIHSPCPFLLLCPSCQATVHLSSGALHVAVVLHSIKKACCGQAVNQLISCSVHPNICPPIHVSTHPSTHPNFLQQRLNLYPEESGRMVNHELSHSILKYNCRIFFKINGHHVNISCLLLDTYCGSPLY